MKKLLVLLISLIAFSSCSEERERDRSLPLCSSPCSCDETYGCDVDCSCDPECGGCRPACESPCACDQTTACDPDCHCDPECDVCVIPPNPSVDAGVTGEDGGTAEEDAGSVEHTGDFQVTIEMRKHNFGSSEPDGTFRLAGLRFTATIVPPTPDLTGQLFMPDSNQLLTTFSQLDESTWQADVTFVDIHAIEPFPASGEKAFRRFAAVFTDANGAQARAPRGQMVGCDRAFCVDGCHNTYTDEAHCGACGNDCGAGASCERGACACGSVGQSGCFSPPAGVWNCAQFCEGLGRSCDPFCGVHGSVEAEDIALFAYSDDRCTRSPHYSFVQGADACNLNFNQLASCDSRCAAWAQYERDACYQRGDSNCDDQYDSRIDNCPSNCAGSISQVTHFKCCCGSPTGQGGALCEGQAGINTCAQLLVCVSACNQDQTCINQCAAEASPQAIADYQALAQCAQSYCGDASSQAEFSNCVALHCGNESADCR